MTTSFMDISDAVDILSIKQCHYDRELSYFCFLRLFPSIAVVLQTRTHKGEFIMHISRNVFQGECVSNRKF